MKNFSILVLAKGFPPTPGGVETYSKSVADSYAKLGYSVRVVSAHSRTSDLDGAGNIHKYSHDKIVGIHQPILLAKFVKHLFSLRKRAEKPDLIHATTWRMAIPALAIYPSIPLVITCHGNEILLNGPLRHLMHLIIMRAHRIVCVSTYTKNLLENLLPSIKSGIAVAYNGVQNHSKWEAVEGKWLPSQPVIRILSVCRHEKRKNLIAAVEAVSSLEQPVEYLIAGTGPMSARISDTINSLGMQGRIRMLGRVSDQTLQELYTSSHIFLHPQIDLAEEGDVEGFGLVVADAMAHACLPVVGRNGGTAELVADNETGISLVTCSPEEIALRLNSLLDNPPAQRAMAAAAKKFADETFSWEAHALLAAQGI